MATVICYCGSENQVDQQDGGVALRCTVCDSVLPTPVLPTVPQNQSSTLDAAEPTGRAGMPNQPNQESRENQETSLIRCPGCGRYSPDSQDRCFVCGDPLPRAGAPGGARLALPGGVVVEVQVNEIVLLGRHSSDPAVAAVLRTHDQVSRRHAELLVEGPTARVRDLGSTNGTFVNGVRVDGETVVGIADGVRIRFGRELEVVLLPGGRG